MKTLLVNAVLACLAAANGIAKADKIIELSNHPQLFLDDYLIADIRNLKRELVHPQKNPEPVIVQDQPWEQRLILHPTVVFDATRNLFQCWYLSSEGETTVADSKRLAHSYRLE